MQGLDAADPDDICPGALDVGAHAVQEVRTINYVRFPRGVFDDGVALCQRSGHHDVDGGTDRDHIHEDVRAVQILCRGDDHAMADLNGRAKRPESLKMLIDRPAADIATAGQRDFRAFVFTKKRTQQIIGCADLLYEFVVHTNRPDCRAANTNCVSVDAFRSGSDHSHSLQ